MSSSLKDVLIESLDAMRALGLQKLHLDDEARLVLRDWMRKKPASHEPPPEAAQAQPSPMAHKEPTPLAAKPKVASSPKVAAVPQSVEEKLSFLRRKAAKWPAAISLGSLSKKLIFGSGNPHARLMVVGDAPSLEDERAAAPFADESGQKMKQIIAAMEMDEAEVYFTNVCPFRPLPMAGLGGGKRPLNDDELAACLPLILAEIRAIKPACILCLGKSAVKALLNSASSVGTLRGEWLECQGIPLRVSYHPLYLLRDESRELRRAVWEDALALMQKLSLPISTRQQQYFLLPPS